MKIVLVGDTRVGKSCLLSQLITGTFNEGTNPTVGTAFQTYTITTENESVTLQIWDTAGQEKFRSLASMYYRSADVALLVFDVTNPDSYNAMDQWLSELVEKGPAEMKIMIVANKCDLTEQRIVETKDAKKFATDHGTAGYFEVSAKTGTGVLDLFTAAAFANTNYIQQQSSVNLDIEPNQEKESKCC